MSSTPQKKSKHSVVRSKEGELYCSCRGGKKSGASLVREVVNRQYTGVVKCFWGWKVIPGKHF